MFSVDVKTIHDDGTLSDLASVDGLDRAGAVALIEQHLRDAAPGAALDLTVSKYGTATATAERVEAPLNALLGATVTAVEDITDASAVLHFDNGAALYVDAPTVYRDSTAPHTLTPGDRVYIYPVGFGEGSKLQGRPATVTAINPHARVAVELLNGDPRSPFCRKEDGILYLNVSEVARERRNA